MTATSCFFSIVRLSQFFSNSFRVFVSIALCLRHYIIATHFLVVSAYSPRNIVVFGISLRRIGDRKVVPGHAGSGKLLFFSARMLDRETPAVLRRLAIAPPNPLPASGEGAMFEGGEPPHPLFWGLRPLYFWDCTLYPYKKPASPERGGGWGRG